MADLVVRERDALAGLDEAPIVGEGCAWLHIQTPGHRGVHQVGRREAPTVHHNVRNGAQLVSAVVGHLHFKAWNLVAGDLALRDTDISGVAVLERTQVAIHCCPAFPTTCELPR